MSNIEHIHKDKQPRRIHYIAEWAEKFNLTQADIMREIDVDKSTVSRWFSNSSVPTPKMLERLAALFEMEGDLNAIFRHPSDDWLKKLFADKGEAQKQHAIELLKLHWKDVS